jgi:hypothetical protein
MSTNHRYTTNPLTGRTIRVGGQTFNQLVMESFDYLDGRLVRRANAPPLREREIYLNIDTGREVQFGTRTYFHLIQNAGYEIIEDYYLVPPRLAVVADYNRDILHIQNTQERLERLNHEQNMFEIYQRRIGRPDLSLIDILERFDADTEIWRQVFDRLVENLIPTAEQERARENRQQEAQLARLTDLNLALCKRCLLPVKLDELPENGLCEDCNQEV